MSSTPPYPHGQSDNTDELRRVFIQRVHQLLKLGYDRMDPAAFVTEEEPAITGELARGIEEVCDDPHSAKWMSCFTAHDDPPVHSLGRKGKQRRRVDIRLDSLEDRPRQRFSFEAKRLSKSTRVSAYLGPEGLGCFLAGEYAPNQDAAGMLGYVQSDNADVWANRIETALAKSPNSYGVLQQSPWRQHPLVTGLTHTYRSGHQRAQPAPPIEIYHTLLVFC